MPQNIITLSLMILSIMTFSIMALSIMTLSVMTLNRMTFSTMTLSVITISITALRVRVNSGTLYITNVMLSVILLSYLLHRQKTTQQITLNGNPRSGKCLTRMLRFRRKERSSLSQKMGKIRNNF
jgi:hypothetical protein